MTKEKYETRLIAWLKENTTSEEKFQELKENVDKGIYTGEGRPLLTGLNKYALEIEKFSKRVKIIEKDSGEVLFLLAVRCLHDNDNEIRKEVPESTVNTLIERLKLFEHLPELKETPK